MSDPTPTVGGVNEPSMLSWSPTVYHTTWGFDIHFAVAGVSHLPTTAPDPTRPWEADLLGPAQHRFRGWFATAEAAQDAVEEWIGGYIDATWPDDDLPTITIEKVTD